MKKEELKADFLLLLTAAIWGFAFVAQRMGAQYIGAFTFNGIRFALGAFSLLPLIAIFARQRNNNHIPASKSQDKKAVIYGGLLAGIILFSGASLQQIGIASTEAGKTAFITGLYIVLVPLFASFIGHRIQFNHWLGAFLAIIGLFLLSVNSDFSIARGDFLILIGAFFWSTHILVIDYLTKKTDPLQLSVAQFLTCSALSLICALIFEDIQWAAIKMALIPILYGGLCSVGIAYTLQVVGQKHAHPTHAAIILSLEAVFGAIGGIWVLGEVITSRGYIGCALMLAGMVISQFKSS